MAHRGRVGATKGGTVFTYVYIETYFKNFMKKNHCARKTENYMKA
jgi:hypothetical protein